MLGAGKEERAAEPGISMVPGIDRECWVQGKIAIEPGIGTRIIGSQG
jgi:hypothetical protein